MKIALTGGPASGKSSISSYLRDRMPGYAFVSYESLCRDLFKQPEFLSELKAVTGVHSYEELQPQLWTDARTRAWFNSSVSRWVFPALSEQLTKESRIVVVVPRLLENKGLYELFDYVIAAVCDIPTQHDRLIEQTGLDLFTIEECLVNDFSSHLTAAVADSVIDTSDGEQYLAEQLDELVKDVSIRSLQYRAERFFGTTAVWEYLEPRLPRLGGHYHGAYCLSQFFALLDKHRGIVLDPTAMELALWFYYTGFSVEDLESFQRWRQLSVKTMWQMLKKVSPKHLQAHHSVALASEMILATNLFTAKTRGSLGKLNWQRDIGVFLDFFTAFMGALPECEALRLAKGIEAMFQPLFKMHGYSLAHGIFSRYVRMSGSFNHPEMAFHYKAGFERNFRLAMKHMALDLELSPEDKLMTPAELIQRASDELRRA